MKFVYLLLVSNLYSLGTISHCRRSREIQVGFALLCLVLLLMNATNWVPLVVVFELRNFWIRESLSFWVRIMRHGLEIVS